MNRAVQATMVVALCLVVMSCASSRRVVYLQEKSVEIPESSVAFDARIMPKDLITISVSTPEPEAALPFNLIVPSAQSATAFPVLSPNLHCKTISLTMKGRSLSLFWDN